MADASVSKTDVRKDVRVRLPLSAPHVWDGLRVSTASGLDRPSPTPFPVDVTCGKGCGRTEGYRCEYKDPRGKRCIWWCVEHSVWSNSRNWCRRHSNSVKWLSAGDGSIYEINESADIDDRSPNLVAIIVDELNADVTAFLNRRFAKHPDAKVVTDANVRKALTGREAVLLSGGRRVAWERGWGVFSDAGYLCRIALGVTAAEPPVVHAFVNGEPVFSRVPDWIANREKGTDAAQDHANFRAAVLDALQRTVPRADEE